MVVDAMIYMYFIGLGVAGGVATVGFISWKIYKRLNNQVPKKAKRGIV